MAIRMIARGIRVEMYLGICDFEFAAPQTVIVNVEAEAELPYRPASIDACLDYSRVCAFVQAWQHRPHTELVETLLHDVVEFCFDDARVQRVSVEILKPDVIVGVTAVGVAMHTDRASYDKLRAATAP